MGRRKYYFFLILRSHFFFYFLFFILLLPHVFFLPPHISSTDHSLSLFLHRPKPQAADPRLRPTPFSEFQYYRTTYRVCKRSSFYRIYCWNLFCILCLIISVGSFWFWVDFVFVTMKLSDFDWKL